MASPNGMHNPNASYMMPPPMLANAGHHSDMSHVWSLIDELSSLLEANRQQFNALQNQIAAQEASRAAKAGSEKKDEGRRQITNHDKDQDKDQNRYQGRNQERNQDSSQDETTKDDTNYKQPDNDTAQVNDKQAKNHTRPTQDDHDPNDPKPDTRKLVAELAESERYILTLEKAYTDQSDLLIAYEDGLSNITKRLRDHIYSQHTSILDIHSHYASQLQEARSETLAARLTHQAWQAGFARLGGDLRGALRVVEDGTLGWRRRVAGLKEENRVLRLRCGIEAGEDSSEDEGGVEEMVGKV